MPNEYPTDPPREEAGYDLANGPLDAEAAGEEPLAESRPRGLNSLVGLISGNLLLIGMYAAGLGSLYIMRLVHGPANASAAPTQMESSVDTALAALGSVSPGSLSERKTSDIVNMFYYRAEQRQIPACDLRTNPFVLKDTPQPATQPAQTEGPPVGAEPANPASEQGEALAAVKGLRLQSVLMGTRQTVAIISDNLLTEGQSIRGWTVERILPREVLLKWRDQSYALKMAE